MKKSYLESMRKEISCILLEDRRLTGMATSCIGTAFLRRVNEVKIEGSFEVTGIRGRRRKLLLYLMESRIYWKLKEEALDRTVWRIRFEKVCGPVVRQTI